MVKIRAIFKHALLAVLMTISASTANSDKPLDGKSFDKASTSANTYYATKTPYLPQQDIASYEAAPSGFAPIFTEMVARHGSRGLSNPTYDLAMYNIWQNAKNEGALRASGAQLGTDIMRVIKANVLLGYCVAGISKPGYGNLTQCGINEEKELAMRLFSRLSWYFSQVAASDKTTAPRHILVISSGKDRVVNSADFFIQSLAANDSRLAPLIARPPASSCYSDGINRFLLCFHELTKKTDLIVETNDPYYQTYRDSLAYQKYKNTDVDLAEKIRSILNSDKAKTAARAVLENLFTKEFVNKIDNGTYTFDNSGSYTFTSDDGFYTTTVTGIGKTKVKGLTEAALMLYNLYIIVPAMKKEVGVDFGKYISPSQASVLAYLDDAQTFYEAGPGIKEDNPITYKMAQVLLDDFFKEIDTLAKGDLSCGAKLRFTHAEEIIPFASLLGLKNIFVPMARSETYTYENNPWRGRDVAPMAANIQWDVYSDGKGTLLVKMLYNERETDFKPSCDDARYKPGSHFYDYRKLKKCYFHTSF